MKGDVIHEVKRWTDFERMERRESVGIACKEKIGEAICFYCKDKFICAHIEVVLSVKKEKAKQASLLS